MNEIVPASLEHALELAPRLRRADLRELEASVGGNPADVLVGSLALSTHAWAWLRDGEVMALVGVAPKYGSEGVGVPWMLASEGADAHPLYILRRSPEMLRRALEAYPVLENWVDCRNTSSIQWLAWMGFAMCEVSPFYGALRLPFIRFSLARRT